MAKMAFVCKLSLLSVCLYPLYVQAQDYSKVVFFGDSLSDSGYFEPVTKGTLGLSQSGKFTTNPDKVWTEVLAENMGEPLSAHVPYIGQVGNNYAIGGARAGEDFVHSAFNLPVSSVKTQISQHLGANALDKKALYSVWVGANDLFAAAEDRTNAQSIVLSAVKSQSEAVQALHDHGAKYILVPNIPDVGLTPQSISLGITSEATQSANLYNTLLSNALKNTGANVIPLDTFSLLQEVASSPMAYGFSNMTTPACTGTSSLVCGTSSLVNANAAQTYFFADGIHPTGKAHQMIGDYAYMAVSAPIALKKLGKLSNTKSLEVKNTHGLWVDATYDKAKIANFDGDGQGLTLGVGIAHQKLSGSTNPDSKAVSGLFVHYNQKDWQGSGLGFDIKEASTGIYHHGEMGRWHFDAQAGLGRIEADSQRAVSLGNYHTQHQAQSKGKKVFAAAQLGTPITLNTLTLQPYVGVDISRVSLDGLKETSSSATALSLDNQTHQIAKGKFGIKATMPIHQNWTAFTEAAYLHTLDEKSTDAKASLNSLPTQSYQTPQPVYDDSEFKLGLGLKGQLAKAQVELGLNYQKSENDDGQSLFVGVSYPF